jgi:hypothetical protein
LPAFFLSLTFVVLGASSGLLLRFCVHFVWFWVLIEFKCKAVRF